MNLTSGSNKTRLLFVAVICGCLFMLQCRATRDVIEEAVSPITEKLAGERVPALPPEKEYAGEVLAYLMQLILGQAGNPDVRDDWSTRG